MKTLFILSWLVLLSSCATPMKPLNQNEFFETEIGFRFKPPQNGSWYRMKTPDDTGYVFGHEPSAQDKKDGSTVMAEVRYGFINLSGLKLKGPKETLNFFERSMKDPGNTNRFESNKNNFTPTKYKKADCMEFDQSGVDKLAKSLQGEKMVMSYKGILCLHPKDPGRYISLSLSQRKPVSRNLTDLKSDEKAFYDTLEFTELKGVSPQ